MPYQVSLFLQGVLGAAGNFTSIVGVIGIFSSFAAYLSGRRQHLFAPTQRDSHEAAMSEIRQSLATLTAAVAALGAPTASGPSAPPVSAPAQAPAMPGAPVPLPAPAFPPPYFPVAPPQASPAAIPSLPRTRRVRRPGLAVFAGVGILFTLALIGGLTTPLDSAINTAFAIFYLLGIVLTLVTLVWSCVLAVRIKRWGWLVALILGTIALFFLTLATVSTLLILIFAIWGPAEPPKGKTGTTAPASA
jgi:hypothetical protein